MNLTQNEVKSAAKAVANVIGFEPIGKAVRLNPRFYIAVGVLDYRVQMILFTHQGQILHTFLNNEEIVRVVETRRLSSPYTLYKRGRKILNAWLFSLNL